MQVTKNCKAHRSKNIVGELIKSGTNKLCCKILKNKIGMEYNQMYAKECRF